MSRGASQLLIESCINDHGEDAIVVKDEASRVDSRGNRFTDIRGRKDHTGPTFEPSDHYDYAVEPLDRLATVLERHAGPPVREEQGDRRRRGRLARTGDR